MRILYRWPIETFFNLHTEGESRTFPPLTLEHVENIRCDVRRIKFGSFEDIPHAATGEGGIRE